MSCIESVKTFEVVEIVLNEVKKSDIIKLERTICSIISQKLEKLNILIKEANVYSYGNHLLVNDRYRVCEDLESIASAFGFEIKKIDCALRGNNYLISDKLVTLLREIGASFDFGTVFPSQNLSDDIKGIIEHNAFPMSIRADIYELIQNIRNNDGYKVTKGREIIRDYEDGIFVSETKGDWDLDEAFIIKYLGDFSKQCERTVVQANSDMLVGTTELIHSRARQMGYVVEKKQNGKNIQLVLVRSE